MVRFFERVLTHATIKPLYCSEVASGPLTNTDYCLQADEKPILIFKSDLYKFFINQYLLIENVVLDGSNLNNYNPACAGANQDCCLTNDCSRWSPIINTASYQVNDFVYFNRGRFVRGIFNFDYFRDM